MAVELPEPLQWVLLLLAGCRWPEADEDLLRDMAERCRQAASDLTDATESSDAAIKRALDGQQGRASEALAAYWAKYATGKGTPEEPGFLPGAVDSLNGMGDMLEATANAAETAKIQIIAQLGILAFEIATAEAEAPFTAGASLLQVPVMVGVSRTVVTTILKTLLKEMIEMAAKQAAQMAAINLLAQGIQVAEGHRKSIDMKELGQNALGGAVGGASAHLIGKGIGGAGAKLGAERALNSTVGKVATGAAVGVGADVSTQLITTGKVDSESLLGSGLSGGAGAGLHAGSSAIKGHLNAPKAGDLPHVDTSGTRSLDGGDGQPTFSKPTPRSVEGSYHGPSGEGSGSSGGGGGSTSRSLDGGGSTSGTGTHGTTEGRPSSSPGESRVNGLTPFGSSRSLSEPSSPTFSRTEVGQHTPTEHAATATTRSLDSTAQRSVPAEPTQMHAAVPRQESVAARSDSPVMTPREQVQAHEPTLQRSHSEPTLRQDQPVTAREPQLTRTDSTPVTPHEPTLQRSPDEPTVRQEPQLTRTDSTPVTPHEPTVQRSPVEPTVRQEPQLTRTDSAPATPHEPAVRQEPLLARTDSTPVTPPEPALQRSHSEPTLRQEQPTVHEPLLTRTDSAPVTAHEPTLQRSPVEPTVTHDPSPRPSAQESAPPPVHQPVPERGSTETTVQRQEPPAESTVSRPATPVHEQSAPAPAPVAHSATPVRESVTESSNLPPQQPLGTTSVPNLAGALGGTSGHTTLDGGTRISGGQSPTRNEPEPVVTGRVSPEPSATPQTPAATPPVPNGFVTGPVGGHGTATTGNHGSSTTTRPAEPAATPSRPTTPTATPTTTPSGGGSLKPGPERTPRRPAPTDDQVYDGFREFMGRVDPEAPAPTHTPPSPEHQQPPKAAEEAPTTTNSTTTAPETTHVPPASHPATSDATFPPPGPRVPVTGDGLCLLNSLAVSAPGLPGAHGTGAVSPSRRLQTAVDRHFTDLPREQWPPEVVANYRNHQLGRPDLTANDLLAYLPRDVRDGYVGMPLDDLRGIVGDHLAHNTPPPTPKERDALLRTVRDWRNRWLTTEGEMLPAAAAHALNLRMRVLDHDGIPLAIFGPPDGQQVTVYHRGNHYDGSEPAPVHTPAVTPTPNPTPEVKTPEVKTEDPTVPKAEDPTTKDPEVKDPEAKDPEVKPEEPGEKPATPPEAEPKTPATETTAPRPIAGNDLVVGLTGNEAAVRQKVIDVLSGVVPGDRAAARAFADAHFGPATLRPMLSALSRGETWTVPLEGNGWSGNIKLRGEVTESTHLRTEKIEFENGADRTVALGGSRDSQWQFNIGAQTRQAGAGAEGAELASYFHDRGQGEVNLDLGGMVARSKTSEPADVFETKMKLELDFGSLRHDHQPVTTDPTGSHTEAVDLSLNVAVPQRPDGDSVGDPRTPPQRLLDGRVGGQEIVLDLSPHGGGPTDKQPVEALLDQVEKAAQQEFGKNWPAMREKVLSEVDFPRLQRDLKSMTAGEPSTVTLKDRHGRTIGSVEISAKVGDLRQTGTTKETEFNIGTSVQQVRSTASNRGNAGQFGLAGALRPGPAVFSGGGAGRLGRDHVEISGDSRTSQLTSKSKVPGVRYEGPVQFEMTFNGKPETHAAGTADVKLLVDRADTTVPRTEDTTPAPKTDESTPAAPKADETAPATPKPDETTPAPKADETTPPPTHEVTSPPDSVWRGGNDRGGLGETVVVRDLESTAALRKAVDAQGRERFGKDWDSVREQVLQGFSQPNLAAKLTGMTRGEPLEIKIPGKENLVVTATARVDSMTYRREDGKAELNTVNETGSFHVDRNLLSRTALVNGQFGGTVARPTPGAPGADLIGGVNGQQRDRAGAQGRQADRVYANGKYSAPQVIYGAGLTVDVHFGPPGDKGSSGRSDTSAPLKVEVGLDSRDTVKVQAPRTEDGTVDFKRPAEPAPGSKPPAEAPKPAPPEATHVAPRRMREQHELNASYVVHSLNGADKVRSSVEDAVRNKYGEPSQEVKQKLDASLDRVALKTKLSQLTRGGQITETISGTTWKAEVTVTARLQDSTYHSKADKYEFESGSRSSRGQGNLRDGRERFDGGGLLRMRAPIVDATGGYTYRMDRTYGHGSETIGSASNRGKHVEPAVFFDVNAAYDVKVEFTRLGVNDGTHVEQVGTVARVAVPTRDADPVSGPVDRPTTTQPKGFVEGRRLDSSAIVTDVHALPDPTPPKTDGTTPPPRQTLGESLLTQVESGWKPNSLLPSFGRSDGKPKLESNPFGSDWPGLRSKLDAELTPDKLQARLKGMTAGDEIVVHHGRTTVRVGAVLRDRMEHLGDSGTTEFNTGTDVQRSFADTKGTAHGHQGLLGVTAAVPIPNTPVSVTAGLTGTGGRGQEHAETANTSTSAGSATKAKLPGSAFRGEAELQFTMTRRPLVGPSVHQQRTAAIGFETIVETGETVPVPKPATEDATTAPAEPPRTLSPDAPATTEVRVPPERVWEGGLKDSDVLRFLGDVGGVQDLARLRGPEFFGRKTWDEMAPLVSGATSHSQLSALFTTATQGTEVSATVPTKRITLGGGKGLEVGMKIVSLEHLNTEKASESSPSNSVSSGTVHSDPSAKNAGAQGLVGARITGDVTHNPALTGGAQRFWREGGTHGDFGQVISNAKYPVPMARYQGHAEVELTLFDGKQNPVKETGIIPFTVDIPLADTTKADLPSDSYLAFTPEHHGGELRSTEDSGRLDDVHRTLSGTDAPFDHTSATPAEREQLLGTLRVGQAAYGGEFSPATEAGTAHIRATDRLVELSGGSSTATSTLLGDLLGKPAGTPLTGDELRQVVDYVERKSAQGPVTLDDLVAGAKDGWPEHEPYDVHRATWTDHGPANELVTAAMAEAAAAAAPLLQSDLPPVGKLYLTVSGEGPNLPLRQEHDLTGDPAQQLRTIEESTYLGPGNRPTEVGVRLAAAPESDHPWDYRVTARPEGSRELTIRHHRTPEDHPQDDPLRTATTSHLDAADTFVTSRTTPPPESA
ncbi:WXG100-like domain-containing protein [Kitasatospora sp. NPDC001664]